MSIEALSNIATSRTQSPIFPNLQEIRGWVKGPALRDATFMHSSVTSLTFFLDEIWFGANVEAAYFPTTKEFQAFVEMVLDRMPFIESLEMGTDGPIADVDGFEDIFCDLCVGLPQLSKLTLPIYHFTQKTASALSCCENIRTIAVYMEGKYPTEIHSRRGIRSFAPVLQPNAFQSLLHLSFAATFVDATSFLTQPNSPSANLLSLSVHILEGYLPEKKNALSPFLKMLSKVAASLDALEVVLAIEDDSHGNPAASHDFTDISSVLSFSRLTKFRIRDLRPLLITDADIITLATQWPLLEELELNGRPISDESSPLSITSLVHFARHCPKLRILAVYIHHESVYKRFQDACDTSGTVIPRMLALEKLVIGCSPTLDKRPALDKAFIPVARFLMSLLHDPSILGWTSYEEGDDDQWKTIRAMMYLLLEKEMAVMEVEKEKEEYKRKYETMLARDEVSDNAWLTVLSRLSERA